MKARLVVSVLGLWVLGACAPLEIGRGELFSTSMVVAGQAGDVPSWAQAVAWGDQGAQDYLGSHGEPSSSATAALTAERLESWDQALGFGEPHAVCRAQAALRPESTR